MAEHIYTFDDPPSERDLDKAVRQLENDGVIAYPTDINWAFGCDASSTKALDRIHRLKPSHPKERPFSLICSSIAMASNLVNIDKVVYQYVRKAWPGPFTVLLVANRALPRQINDKRRVVGVRIPDSPLLLALVERFGKPLATSSVPVVPGYDPSAEPAPPCFGYEVVEHFGHGLDMVLDLSSELSGQESTIIDLTEGIPLLVRRGVGDPNIFDISI